MKYQSAASESDTLPFSEPLLQNSTKAGLASRSRYAFTFIDLFAGIGGLRLPFEEVGGCCLFSSEWDRFSQKTYQANFGETPHGDITQISAHQVPPHDILLAGFPCQAFSQAGLKRGFSDTRGTLFFEIQRILAVRRPKAFLLENVKQLKGHDGGRTLDLILKTLRGSDDRHLPPELNLSIEAREALSTRLNYWVDFRVLRAADFGVPQNRERIYIVGIDRDAVACPENLFRWPDPPRVPTKVGDILEPALTDFSAYTISERLWRGHVRRRAEHRRRGNGFGYSLFSADNEYTNTLSARYYKDGSEILIDQSERGLPPRKLTARECARLQGFPEDFIIDAVSVTQAYRQFGNSVAVPVIRAVAAELLAALRNGNAIRSQLGPPLSGR